MIFIYNIKRNNSTAYVLMFVIAILSWLKTFYSDIPGIYSSINTTPIFAWIATVFGNNCILLCKIIALIIVLVQAMIINAISSKYRFLESRTSLPGLIFVILIANITDYHFLHEILIANFFIIIVWSFIANTFNQADIIKTVFNTSFVLGLSTLIYPTYVFFIFFIFVAIWLNRKETLKNILISILGVLCVWYLYFSINYLLWDVFQLKGLDFSFGLQTLDVSNKSYFVYVIRTLILVFIVTSLFHSMSYIISSKAFVRRNTQLLYLWIILGLIMWIINITSLEIIYSIAIPISILLSISLVNIQNKWIRESLWVLLLVLTFLNQWYS